MSKSVPTLAEQRIEEAVAAFREGLVEAALRIAKVDGRPTLQRWHVNKAVVRLLWHKSALPHDLNWFVVDCDEDEEIQEFRNP